MIKFRHILLATTALQSVGGSIGAAYAADLSLPVEPVYHDVGPGIVAVSAPNVTAGGLVCVAGDVTFSALMSVTAPLGDKIGAQFDGVLGVGEDGEISGQAAGHLFTRDPSQGMFGAYAAYVSDGDDGRNDGFRLGGEGEWYLDGFTLSGIVGWDFANEDVFGQARLSAYLGDSTKIYAGYIYEGQSIGALGIEHMFNSNFSGFAEGRYAEDGSASLLAGLKGHFGGGSSGGSDTRIAGNYTSEPASDRTLIERDREDVVPLWLQPCADEDDTTTETTTTTTTAAGA